MLYNEEFSDFKLVTSKNVDPVVSEDRLYYIIVALKGGSFSVTCEAQFDCSYHGYDIEFTTNGIVNIV